MESPLFKPFSISNTHANRGTVAVITWNTLNAATWYVDRENLDGEVSLGHDDRTLLAINFSEYTTKAGDLKEIEGLALGTDVTIADSDRQLVINEDLVIAADDEYLVSFASEFAKEPKKDKDEKSFKDTTNDVVYVYVPEEVCEDLSDLLGKTFTLILGEDDVATLIIIEDDIQEKDYLTAYEVDGSKTKITVGGERYTLSADGYAVTLNGLGSYTSDLEAALADLGVTEDLDDIEKVIEAEVTLDGEDDVKAINLTASYTVANVSLETLVLKVKETSSVYKITTTNGVLEWDLEDEEEEDLDFPRVYVNGVKADIRDIEAGNVLTVVSSKVDVANSKDLDDVTVEDIEKIYVSTNTIVGEPTKITKSNNAIRVDGTYYAPSFDVTASGVKVMTSEELSKATATSDWEAYNYDTILDNEEVTLYLNAYGEYVAISLDEVSTDYTFGLVTYVASNMTNSGDEEEIEEVKVRVLLPEGNKKYFTLSLDTADEDLMDSLSNDSVLDYAPASLEGKFVMFEANADDVITIENDTPFVEVNADDVDKASTIANIGETDYIVAKLVGTIDEEEFTVKYGNDGTKDLTIAAEYDANETVIYNLDDKKIVAKWESIVKADTTDTTKDVFAGTTYMIFEDEDADVPMIVVTDLDKYVASDAVYAIAGEEEVYQVGEKDYADLVGTEGIEFTTGATSKEVLEGWVVEYAMSSSKLSSVFSIINLDKFYNKDTKKHVAKVTDVVNFANRAQSGDPIIPDTQLKVSGHASEYLEAIELDNIKTRSNSYRLEFVETDEDVSLADVVVDDEVIVYDLRDGSVEEIDIEAVQAEVADGESIYAIVCTNGTDDIIFVL